MLQFSFVRVYGVFFKAARQIYQSSTVPTVDYQIPPVRMRSVEAIAETYPIERSKPALDVDDDDLYWDVPLDMLQMQQPEPASAEPQDAVQMPSGTPATEEHSSDDTPADERKSKKPTYAQAPSVFFPVSFGETEGGATIAVATAYNAGPGAVRSHAIAFGMPARRARHPAVVRATHNEMAMERNERF